MGAAVGGELPGAVGIVARGDGDPGRRNAVGVRIQAGGGHQGVHGRARVGGRGHVLVDRGQGGADARVEHRGLVGRRRAAEAKDVGEAIVVAGHQVRAGAGEDHHPAVRVDVRRRGPGIGRSGGGQPGMAHELAGACGAVEAEHVARGAVGVGHAGHQVARHARVGHEPPVVADRRPLGGPVARHAG